MRERRSHEDSAAAQVQTPTPLARGAGQSLDDQAAGRMLVRYSVPEPDDLTVERVWQRLSNPMSQGRRAQGPGSTSWWSGFTSRGPAYAWVMAPAVLAWVVLLGLILVRGPARHAPPRAPEVAVALHRAELGAARGGVFFSRPAESWQPGRSGQALSEGERLRSDQTGMAVLDVPGVASVLIASGTDVAIERLQGGTFLRLSRGSVIPRVSKRPPSEPFVVLTDRFAVAVVGTLFEVDQDGSGRTAVAVREGTVEVTGADGSSFRVQAGQRWVSTETDRRGVSAIADPVKTLLEDGLRGASRGYLEHELEGVALVSIPAAGVAAAPRAARELEVDAVSRPAPARSPRSATGLAPKLASDGDAATTRAEPAPAPVLLAEREPAAHERQSPSAEASAPAPAPAPVIAATPPQTPSDDAYATGLALERSGDLGAAAAALARASEQDPSRADLALYALGRLLQHRLNDPHRALEAFERYRAGYPGGALMPEVDLAVLEIDVQTGDRKRALAESVRFLAAHPASERTDEVRLLRGNLLREGGDCRAALGEYADVASPDFAEGALYGTARCQRMLGNSPAARDALRAYQKRFPAGAHRDQVAKELADGSAANF